MILPKFENSDLYRFSVDSSKFTWFGVGGALDVLFRPKKISDLQHFLKNFEDKSAIKFLGACSNVIIRDGGFRGVVVRLGSGFNYIKKIDNITIEVGASTNDLNVANFAAENGIGGLEFLASIPGSIGGNIKMNAGCYGTDISEVLVSCDFVDMDGNIGTLNRSEIDFSYRHNPIKNVVFTKAVLRGFKDDVQNILKNIQANKARRDASQPTKTKTGGSTFTNPPGHSAWELISRAGLRGVAVGGAVVSGQHCNFLINGGKAKAADIEALGELVRATVSDRFGIVLNWEIERFGDFLR